MHYQDYLQLGLCIEGEGKFLFTDKVYDVAKGDIFLVDNFEKHEAVSDPPQTTRYLFIIFYPELIAPPGSRLFDFEYLSPFWNNSVSFCNKISADTEIAATIAEIMLDCKKIWDKKEGQYKHLIDANLRKMLALLMQYYKTTGAGNSSQKLNYYIKMQPALDYITAHFSEAISLREVSAIVNMSQSRFRHLFKEVTRIGFKEYIIGRRLNEAKRLLLTTDMNISDVMYQVGFSNIYQFYQAFQKQISMTPAEFREHFKKT